MDAAVRAPGQEAHGVITETQGHLPLLSIRAGGLGDQRDQSRPQGLGTVLLDRELESVFLVHPKLGGEEDSASLGSRSKAPGLRLEAVE